MSYPPTQPHSLSFPTFSGVGGIPQHSPWLQQLFHLIANFWSQGYTKAQILDSCAEVLNREHYEYAYIILDYIEAHTLPSPAQEYRYREEIAAAYRRNPTPKTMHDLANKTQNVYFEKMALQAAEVLEKAAAEGRLPTKQGSITLADPMKIIQLEQVSVFLFGNTGSGKSSVASKIVSEFSRHWFFTTGKKVEILVLDPHLNDWGTLPIVDEQVAILRTQTLLVKELIRRRRDWSRQVRELPPKQRQKNWSYLIIIWDEVDDALSFADTKEGKELIKKEKLFHPADSLRILGSQIRKFRGMLIALNQSGNCEAVGLDSRYRSNYIDIHLGESALLQAAQLWKSDTPERLFLESRREGYPCIVRNQVAIHPTHGHYQTRAEGLTPAPCEPPLFAPWTLPLPTEPVVYCGKLEDAFGGKIQGFEKTASFPEDSSQGKGESHQMEEIDDPWNDTTTEELLYQAFLDIKQKRTTSPAQSKTEICNGWSGKTEEKFLRYDLALEQYGHLWIKELLKDGLLPHTLDELVTLFWGVPKNRNHRKKFFACKRQLTELVKKLDIPTQSKTSDNIIPFPKKAHE